MKLQPGRSTRPTLTSAPGLAKAILGTFNNASSKKRFLRYVDPYSEPDKLLTSPQYCTPTMRDLPNMGESARGKSSDPTTSQPPQQSTSHPIAEQPRVAPTSQPAVAPPSTTDSKVLVEANSSDASGGWADLIWQKWRWGLFIAIAVVVSRLSSS